MGFPARDEVELLRELAAVGKTNVELQRRVLHLEDELRRKEQELWALARKLRLKGESTHG